MIRYWGSLQDLRAEPALDAALGDIDAATMNRYSPLGIDEVLTQPAVQEHFLRPRPADDNPARA
jgi:hypothetical protein